MLIHGRFIFSFLSIFFLAAGSVMSACTPSESPEAAETEIAGFMLDHILSQEIGDASAVISAMDEPWVEVPADAMLIVWAPPAEDAGQNPTSFVNSDQPIKVWRYAGHQISEAADKTRAIQQYREARIYPSNSRSWGYYEFGILSLARGNSQAQVYLGVSCGPLCGQGVVYTLERESSGAWQIVDTQPRWIS